MKSITCIIRDIPHNRSYLMILQIPIGRIGELEGYKSIET